MHRFGIPWLLYFLLFAFFVWIADAQALDTLQQCISAPPPKGVGFFLEMVDPYRHCAGAFVSGSPEAVIAMFTVILGISTIGLWISTSRLAEISERTLTDLERPIVYGNVATAGVKIVSSQHQSGHELQCSKLVISVYNFGRTLARLQRIEWVVIVAPHGDTPNPIDPALIGGRELPVGTVCVSGEAHEESKNMILHFTPEETCEIIKGKQSIWVVGFARYNDIFSGHHITGFGLVFDPISERFVRHGGEKFNYERGEKSSKIPPPSSNS